MTFSKHTSDKLKAYLWQAQSVLLASNINAGLVYVKCRLSECLVYVNFHLNSYKSYKYHNICVCWLVLTCNLKWFHNSILTNNSIVYQIPSSFVSAKKERIPLFCSQFFVTLTSLNVGCTSTMQKILFLFSLSLPTFEASFRWERKKKINYIYLALCSVFTTFVRKM